MDRIVRDIVVVVVDKVAVAADMGKWLSRVDQSSSLFVAVCLDHFVCMMRDAQYASGKSST